MSHMRSSELRQKALDAIREQWAGKDFTSAVFRDWVRKHPLGVWQLVHAFDQLKREGWVVTIAGSHRKCVYTFFETAAQVTVRRARLNRLWQEEFKAMEKVVKAARRWTEVQINAYLGYGSLPFALDASEELTQAVIALPRAKPSCPKCLAGNAEEHPWTFACVDPPEKVRGRGDGKSITGTV